MKMIALLMVPGIAWAQVIPMPAPNPALGTPAFMSGPPAANQPRAPFTNGPPSTVIIPMPGPTQTAPGRLLPQAAMQSIQPALAQIYVNPVPRPGIFQSGNIFKGGEIIIR